MIRRFHRSAWLSEKSVPIGTGIGRRNEGRKEGRKKLEDEYSSKSLKSFLSRLPQLLLVGTACIDNNRVVVG